MVSRIAVFLLLSFAPVLALSPAEWVPMRWEGGPLDVIRRAAPLDPEKSDEPNRAEATPEAVLLAWYDPAKLALLDGSPFNCLIATWSLGATNEQDAAQRAAVTAFAKAAQGRKLAVLGAIHAGPDWREALQAAAAAGLDGVTLEGEFAQKDVESAFDLMAGRGVVVPIPAWDRVSLDPRAPILAAGDGLWPGMLTADDDANGWHSAPTSNPWVLSNSWRVDALRSEGSGRPVWLGHRPKLYRDQPFELRDYIRAVADAAMANGRWIVALDASWQTALAAGDQDVLAEWKKLGDAIRVFDARPDWKSMLPEPALVLVRDPARPDVFATTDVLNMLAVRHVPHRVILRSAFENGKTPQDAAVLAYDQAPPNQGEHDALQAFADAGGMLIFGPVWSMYEYKGGPEFQRVIPGKGSKVPFPAPELNGDKFASELRDRLEKKHAAPKIYNVGTIMSRYAEDPDSGRAVLQLTEYSDYPTENVTVRLPAKMAKARFIPLEGPAEDLEIYGGEEGSEVVIPEVPYYCAVVLEPAQDQPQGATQ
jgi:hypothetical protein